MPRKAIEIDGLTKDYYTGFWRKRPQRALDRLALKWKTAKCLVFWGRTAPVNPPRSNF